MSRRLRLRRRLLWAGVLLGLVALLVVVSVLRVCVWGRDVLTHHASRTGRRATEGKEEAMTRALTLVVGIAVAAVVIVPAALGEGRLAPPSPRGQVATYRDAGERPAARPGALDLAAAAGRLDVSTLRKAFTTYRDAGERAAPAATSVATTAETPSATSGRGIEWPQIGIGFALGIVLVVGLGLGVHVMRARPVAL